MPAFFLRATGDRIRLDRVQSLHHALRMPTIRRFPRCRLDMYSREHGVPHFHLIGNDDSRGAYAIDTLVVLAGGLDIRDSREALEWAARHRRELRNKWKELNS